MYPQIFTCLCLAVIIPAALSNWVNIQGKAVDISAKGNEVWVANSVKDIYRYDWNSRSWVHIPGVATRVGASPDGWTWAVGPDDKIYRRNKDKGVWDDMPGRLVQVSAMSKDKALGVNRAGNIWLWENNAWKQLPGKATWAGIGDGDERWVVNAAQNIFRWNKVKNNWDHIPGAAVNVDVQNSNRVIVTNKQNIMWLWNNAASKWHPLPGMATRATITQDMTLCVNMVDDIFFAKLNGDGVSLAPFAWPSTVVAPPVKQDKEIVKAAAAASTIQQMLTVLTTYTVNGKEVSEKEYNEMLKLVPATME